jgi:hypothetical protein
MKKYISSIVNIYENRRSIDLYKYWINHNALYYMKYFTILALIITSLLIPFDYIFYESPLIYLSTRVILMTVYILQLIVIFKFFIKPESYSFSIGILLPPLSYNIAYTYFLLCANPSDEFYMTLLLANFVMILISNLFLYKFYKEQYTLTFISVLCLFLLSLLKPSLSADIIKLILFHLLSFLICIYYRYQFITALSSKYDYLSSLLPNKFAKLVSVSDKSLDIEKLFPTKDYYAVCLCSDWRNYQKISTSKEHKEVEKMVEKFYNIIYDALETLDIAGQYYADWTADELFIIFYSEIDEEENVNHEALKFAHSLATKLFLDVSSIVDKDLKYDIGLSSGIGLIGLQGPANYKKTSITGEVAGNAKRFETQAKVIRSTIDQSFPIIVMDKTLGNYAKSISLYGNLISSPIVGDVKDIVGKELTYWHLDIK